MLGFGSLKAHPNVRSLLSRKNMKLFSELHTEISDIIATMPDIFDSHDFIRKFAQAQQHAYIQALYELKDSERPFNALHQQIGKLLKKEFAELLEYTDNQDSPDIFGNTSECAVWQKLS